MSTQHDDACLFRLTPALTIEAAEDLLPRLREHLAAHPGIIIDLSEVEACDAIGLQLLCAARKSAADSGKRFSVVGSGPLVESSMAQVGLSIECLASI